MVQELRGVVLEYQMSQTFSDNVEREEKARKHEPCIVSRNVADKS